MKLESKLFDSIRIKSRREATPAETGPRCEWEGCTEKGEFRAPKGHKTEGQYHNFCKAHIRQYNATFNFFAGMSAAEQDEHLTSNAQTAGRPTSRMGTNPNVGAQAQNRANSGPRVHARGTRFHDPLGVFARAARASARAPQKERVKPMQALDKRAIEVLGLEPGATSDDIKKAYKALVKIHHPDANGGDRSSEDRLRAVIVAYTHLKTAGFVTR
jgi:hypothetical protein